MKKIISLTLACLCLFACSKGGNNEDSAAISQKDALKSKYEILDKKESVIKMPDNQSLTTIKYVVRLDSDFPQATVDEIADEIKGDSINTYVFINFFLPEQATEGTPYAEAVRTPDEKTSVVYGTGPGAAAAGNRVAPYNSKNVIGSWNMSGTKVVAYTKKGKCYMVDCYSDGTYGTPEAYKEESFQGMKAFRSLSNQNSFYVINESGDLDGYNGRDYAVTYPKAK